MGHMNRFPRLSTAPARQGLGGCRGTARLNPADRNVAESWTSLPSRAAMANQLFAAAAWDIEAVTHEPVATSH